MKNERTRGRERDRLETIFKVLPLTVNWFESDDNLFHFFSSNKTKQACVLL